MPKTRSKTGCWLRAPESNGQAKASHLPGLAANRLWTLPARALCQGSSTLTPTFLHVGFKNDRDVRGILDASLAIKEKLVVYFQKFNVERVMSFKLPRIGGCFSCAE